jgi:hypothetical protein
MAAITVRAPRRSALRPHRPSTAAAGFDATITTRFGRSGLRMSTLALNANEARTRGVVEQHERRIALDGARQSRPVRVGRRLLGPRSESEIDDDRRPPDIAGREAGAERSRRSHSVIRVVMSLLSAHRVRLGGSPRGARPCHGRPRSPRAGNRRRSGSAAPSPPGPRSARWPPPGSLPPGSRRY